MSNKYAVTDAEYREYDDGDSVSHSNANAADEMDGSWAARAKRAEQAELENGRNSKSESQSHMESFRIEDANKSKESAIDGQAPDDKCAFTYIAFMTLGIGLLLPWNAGR